MVFPAGAEDENQGRIRFRRMRFRTACGSWFGVGFRTTGRKIQTAPSASRIPISAPTMSQKWFLEAGRIGLRE